MERMKIHRWQDSGLVEVEDRVAEEAFLRLRINGHLFRRAALSPEDVWPFVVGHLRGEGLISRPEEIARYAESREPPWILVEVEIPELEGAPKPSDTLWTGCGAAPAGPAPPELAGPTPSFTVPGEALLRLPLLIKDHVQAFRATGAYHYAFLLDAQLSLRQVARDIGRHSAVDKAIGQELVRGGCLEGYFLYLTGRVTEDIVIKMLRCGIPLTVSKAAALTGAIALARRHGLGLVGFLRGKRFNVYSRPDLIG